MPLLAPSGLVGWMPGEEVARPARIYIDLTTYSLGFLSSLEGERGLIFNDPVFEIDPATMVDPNDQGSLVPGLLLTNGSGIRLLGMNREQKVSAINLKGSTTDDVWLAYLGWSVKIADRLAFYKIP
jgi:hypothetical protein